MALSNKQKDRLNKAILANKEKFQIRIDRYNESPLRCSYCQLALDYDKRKNKFCSHTCSAKHSNENVPRNYKTGLYSLKPCLLCRKPTSNKKCCSSKCCLEDATKRWIDNVQKNGICCGTPSTIKKRLIKLDGNRCSICGITEWLGKPVPLVLDHINGKPADNTRVNLRLVCGNCNMQLPTFAGRNVGKGGGRPYRKIRYRKGLSY